MTRDDAIRRRAAGDGVTEDDVTEDDVTEDGVTEDGVTGEDGAIDDFSARVLDVVDAIPPGQVMSYGDIADYLQAGGPRQVGRVMSRYGGGAPWWRVTHADGTPPPGQDAVALRHFMAEKTPLRSAQPVRVDMREARWRGGR